MDVLVTLLLASVTQAASLLAESRQMVGLAAALLAALLAARLGWHGTDRLITWRSRTDED
ncbi:hypothetical protein GCM10023085_75490 [Actinomadura viridis]|uniref:Uncharacterized protein n=1 Tax=Actinomadura viridis TaxID=58110 RepID=A0A931GH81_9ACTN|nr:hypothetical protein [Actinomadura viridis]MBG6086567.1 hypothetical protein [Actinomadura viridis]